jgi:hypothetical protein
MGQGFAMVLPTLLYSSEKVGLTNVGAGLADVFCGAIRAALALLTALGREVDTDRNGSYVATTHLIGDRSDPLWPFLFAPRLS